MKKILGLDLGTNSIGWSLIKSDFDNKKGKIVGMGSRIIPMSQDILGKFESGQSISQTAKRTKYRGTRRLYQRDNLRRARLHRVLNILGFLPEHYADDIDFNKHYGQFKENREPKINYQKDTNGKYRFLFMDSFYEMVDEFKKVKPELFKIKEDGSETKIPLDWTIYYLRKKALTQKISKEELAWVILNFNQKRGYYQLRGKDTNETPNDKEDKIEEYYSLKVINVQTTDDKNAKGIWYNVILENGWIYRRQSKEPLDNWIGTTKEFIVTTPLDKNGNPQTDKEGEIKRSFRSVNSEKDWIAIKKKAEKDIERSGKTVGEYIYEALLKNPKQKIRGELIRTIERELYKEELEKILTEQIKHHPELQNKELYYACVEELYPRNEIHQNALKKENFIRLFMDDIIFYQRPLKSKKSSISGCKFETRTYLKNIIDPITKEEKTLFVKDEPLKAVPKSHPLYQEFRLWQFISNLRIYKKEKIVDDKLKINVDVTDEVIKDVFDKEDLFDFLLDKKEIKQQDVLKFLVSKNKITKNEIKDYRWNYVEEKFYPGNDTRAKFLIRLKKVTGANAKEILTEKFELNLWHIIYSVKDAAEYEKALGTFADKNNLDKNKFIESFLKFPPFESAYGAYSVKALNKLLPLMRVGNKWRKENIDDNTLHRIDRITTGEVDEKIDVRVREKAIKLREIEDFQGLPVWLAEYVVYDLSDKDFWEKPDDIDKYLKAFKQHSLHNPIVEQIVLETLRIVKDIWNYYGNGKEDFFDEIHIELGRDLKNSADKRKEISNKISENEKTNARIKMLLQELIDVGAKPYSPNHQDILKIYEEGLLKPRQIVTKGKEKRMLKVQYDNNVPKEIIDIVKKETPSKRDIEKYRLWLEQGYISPYTGETISLTKLFTHEYEIEHIIPKARFFDNSLSNKVICESAVNKEKGNMTAYEFILKNGGSLVNTGVGRTVKILNKAEYESHCKRYFKSNRIKLEKLMSKDIPEKFIERQLNDTRYISKFVKNLLGNIVREDNEKETTPKNIVTVSGKITSQLKKDWGLNDVWNEIIRPRFERLNALTKSNDFGYWDYILDENGNPTGKKFFRTIIPDENAKNVTKKRIDHRHHALDALVIAACTKDHVSYITSLNTSRNNFSLVNKLRETKEILYKGRKIKVAKAFHKPWHDFTYDTKKSLEKIIVSFKQNLRVINKTNNKTWQWIEKEGDLKKVLVRQTKGDNWAIRKPLHKETYYGKLGKNTGKNKIITASRKPLSEIKNKKTLEKITDSGIKKILTNHLQNYLNEKGEKDFEKAFSPEGVEDLNKNIVQLNDGKFHQPIYKVRLEEEGQRFQVGYKGNKKSKYVEAEARTNLFFAIYWNNDKQKRTFETIPLKEVIEHQKWRATLPKEELKKEPIIPINSSKGNFLFSLSPNELVYVPTDEELEYPHNVDFSNLTKEQVSRIFSVNDFSGNTIYFTPNQLASAIHPKEVDLEFNVKGKLKGSYATKTASFNGVSIRAICWKIEIDKLGNVVEVKRF